MGWQRWRQLIGLPSSAAEHARNLGANLRWLSEIRAAQIESERHLFDRVRREPVAPFPFPPPTPGPDVLDPIGAQRRPLNYLNLHLPDGTTIPIIPLLRLPLVSPGTWTDDDPGAGSVSWAGCQVAHEGEMFEIDDDDTSDPYIYWDKSVSETTFQTSAAQPTIDPTEDLLICYNDGGTAKLAFLSDLVQAGYIVCSQLDALSANMGVLTAGEIRLGSGTPGVDFTGIRVYKDGATYRVAGYSNDVLQAYMDSDGKLKAGGGAITVAAGGIIIDADNAAWIIWEDSGETIAQLVGFYSSGLKISRAYIYGIGKDETDNIGEVYIQGKTQDGSEFSTIIASSKYGIHLDASAATTDKAVTLVDGTILRFNDGDAAIWRDGDDLKLKDPNAGTKVLSDLWFVRADKDGDGDYDPLTAAAWEGVTESGSGTINWNTVFGVPTDAKAVLIYVSGWDATPNTVWYIKAKSTTVKPDLAMHTQVNAVQIDNQGVVAIAADGTSYYVFAAPWDGFYMRVVGWYV